MCVFTNLFYFIVCLKRLLLVEKMLGLYTLKVVFNSELDLVGTLENGKSLT